MFLGGDTAVQREDAGQRGVARLMTGAEIIIIEKAVGFIPTVLADALGAALSQADEAFLERRLTQYTVTMGDRHL